MNKNFKEKEIIGGITFMTFDMLMGLFGGLGLFIYGMNMMSDGLKAVAGDRMKRLLEILTTNRLIAVIVGALVTVIVQSSSTTTVMIVGFVNAGIMNLLQATGVIMGANIGTTITAQMVAFKVTKYAPLAIAIGAVLFLFTHKRRTKQIGSIVLGFGILFLGMTFMSDSMVPLRDHEGFKVMLTSFSSNPILGVIAGFVLTVIVQSSSASVGLVQALAISGSFSVIPGVNPLSLIIPILMGQNIGTCVTSMLSSIGATITAKRAAFIHFAFNLIGTIWFLIILMIMGGPLVSFIENVSGTTTLAGQVVPDVTRQIANTHTIFNIMNTIILFPFAKQLVKLSKTILSGEEKEDLGGLKFLDERILENPAVAVGQAVKEIVRMGSFALENLNTSMKAFFESDEKMIEQVFKKEKIINQLEKDITKYLVVLSNSKLSEKDYLRVTNLFHTLNDIERIGDHAENLAELAQFRMEHKLPFSSTAEDELREMLGKVSSVVSDSIDSLDSENIELAKSINSKEDEIDKIEESLRADHIHRLNKQLCDSSAGVVYLDILSNLERIADHATNISKTVLDLQKS